MYPMSFSRRGGVAVFAAVVVVLAVGPLRTVVAYAPAEGDLAKADPDHIRVLTYNTERKFIKNSSSDPEFQRVIQAIHPDIIAFQEIDDTIAATPALIAQAIKTRLESYFPGETWTVHVGLSDGFIQNALATRFGLSMTITDTVPGSDVRGITGGLVDLPNGTYGATDFYVMAVHFKSFGTQTDSMRRQRYADAIVNWIRDARTPLCAECGAGEQINLPAATPMLAVGDMNLGFQDGGDYAPYHPMQTLNDGDIYDEATYGPDSLPDWDGSESGDAAPFDHNTADAHTQPSDTTNPLSRLDRFIFTDSVLHVENRFVLNTLTMSPAALSAAGLQSNDTVRDANGAPDHLPVVVDFALGPDPASPGTLVVNEFNYDNPGADTYSFVEFKNVGGSEINLQAPVDYHLLTSSNNVPTVPPGTENQNLDIDLQGIIPPGGIFVVYNSAGESSAVATSITLALPLLQRQDLAATGGAFTLFNGTDAAIALVTVYPWTTESGTDTTTDTLVEAYLYEDTTPGVVNYFRTDSGNGLIISLGDAQSSPYALTSASLSYSRNVGDGTWNSFAQWTIPAPITPGLENAVFVNTAPTLLAATGITVGRGATVAIQNTELRASDAEQGPAELIYTVTAFPAHGSLVRGATTLSSGGADTFTQADIDAGTVSYVHDGVGSDPDAFTFSVADGQGGTVPATVFPIQVIPPTVVGDWILIF